MPTMYDDVNAICPFFRGSEKRKIICEGIAEGSSIHLVYELRKDRDIQRRTFCDKKYQNCEVYRMLEELNAE